MVSYEWDENKRLANIDKHGFDFIDAFEVLEGEHRLAPGKTVRGEERRMAFGMIAGMRVVVIYTMRGDAYRIISIRRARHDE